MLRIFVGGIVAFGGLITWAGQGPTPATRVGEPGPNCHNRTQRVMVPQQVRVQRQRMVEREVEVPVTVMETRTIQVPEYYYETEERQVPMLLVPEEQYPTQRTYVEPGCDPCATTQVDPGVRTGVEEPRGGCRLLRGRSGGGGCGLFARRAERRNARRGGGSLGVGAGGGGGFEGEPNPRLRF